MALYVSGQSLNIYSMLGLILLMGIAKKNSIMLVDFTNQVRERGVQRHQALLEACPVRLRPILMTSIATIAGALPPALAIGPGAELQRPMALALVGGMAVSTLLTLFVVPAAYSLLDDLVTWNADRQRRGTSLVASLAALRASKVPSS
jgi:HAE1 family hydrophobic/amphiphilic exporter-1